MAGGSDSHFWPGFALCAGLMGLIAVVAAAALVLFGAGGGSGGPPAQPVTGEHPLEPTGPAEPAVGEPNEDSAPIEVVADAESRKLWPGRGYKVAAVRPGSRVEIRSEPDGELVKQVGARTEFRSPRVFSVIERRGDWIAVATPDTLDNSPGWVQLDTEKLELGRVSTALVADLGEHRVELHKLGAPTRSFPVTIGAAGSATPPGRFAVTDTITRGLSPVYGCCAIALSAHQANLPPGWLGGDRVAIHGTDGPVGGARSAGCLRTDNAVVRALVAELELGTPVEIRA